MVTMTDLLADDDAIRVECRNHTLTATPHLDFRGLTSSEPVLFLIDCSCGGLHMDGTVAEMMTLVQAHLRGHGIPVSQYWPQLHPDHPRAAGRG
jgi:hypothetical protein